MAIERADPDPVRSEQPAVVQSLPGPYVRSRRRSRSLGDRIFEGVTTGFGMIILLIVVAMVVALGWEAWPAIRRFGLGFLTGREWNYVDQFGALPYVWGTVYSSFLALAMALPISLGVAIFLAEMAPLPVRTVLSFLVELLAAIPSVVYGLWGMFVLVPLVRQLELWLFLHAHFIPLFSGPPIGFGMLSAATVLAIMIIPTIASVSRDVLLAVPASQREAALALGATRWEAIKVALSNAVPGIIGATLLGLGRALGETMAVTMVIGNIGSISISLFQPAYSMAALIANEFSEATTNLHVAALIEVGLLLLMVTLVLNLFSRLLVRRVAITGAGSHVKG
ncbi:MAG TPA: phosphate ABC transporter permease subunit PstC [Firmicutes bacterium]|nr:phosphate ABC transporter permease subunit PstC [Bacillota bacterium]